MCCFLCRAEPRNAGHAEVWKRLVAGKLEVPDTWEVSLSAPRDKKETFAAAERGQARWMALLRNLRLMTAARVSPKLIRERLSKGVVRALPFRFVTAARYAPKLEDAIGNAMLKGISGLETLPGATGLGVSGSMNYKLSNMGETTRTDAAGLAILLREKCGAFTSRRWSRKGGVNAVSSGAIVKRAPALRSSGQASRRTPNVYGRACL